MYIHGVPQKNLISVFAPLKCVLHSLKLLLDHLITHKPFNALCISTNPPIEIEEIIFFGNKYFYFIFR